MKLALICCDKNPDWVSCQSIRSNLLDSYLLAYPKAKLFTFSLNKAQNLAVAKKIRAFRADKIVFLESNPSPLLLLYPLIKDWKTAKFPEFLFHIYGDFTVFTPEWMQIETLLIGKRVQIFAASQAQLELFKKFLNKPSQKQVQLCPFPVLKNRFYSDEALRQKYRSKWKIKKDEFFIIYTGRISTQKNVKLVIQWLMEWFSQNSLDKKLKFYIVGQIDDHGAPFWQGSLAKGEGYYDWISFYKSIPDPYKKQIQHLSFKKSEELFQLYNAADLFVSLSTYHDEDYGMSPIEALMCGCPALLTAWAGFQSFAIDENSVKKIPVRLGEEGIEINKNDFNRGLQFFTSSEAEISRQQRSSLYADSFSVEAIAKLLKAYLRYQAPAFYGFSELAQKHADGIFKMRQGQPLFKLASKKDAFYSKVYSSYFSVSS